MLPAQYRLRDNGDFRRIYRKGRSFAEDLLAVHVLRRSEADPPHVRIGFVVSKKQGCAVARNCIRRRLREAVRMRLGALRPGAYDVVLVARSGMARAAWPEVCSCVDRLLTRAGLT